jgi:hypothetical protein
MTDNAIVKRKKRQEEFEDSNAEILLKVALNTKILIQIRFGIFKLLLLPTFWT